MSGADNKKVFVSLARPAPNSFHPKPPVPEPEGALLLGVGKPDPHKMETTPNPDGSSLLVESVGFKALGRGNRFIACVNIGADGNANAYLRMFSLQMAPGMDRTSLRDWLEGMPAQILNSVMASAQIHRSRNMNLPANLNVLIHLDVMPGVSDQQAVIERMLAGAMERMPSTAAPLMVSCDPPHIMELDLGDHTNPLVKLATPISAAEVAAECRSYAETLMPCLGAYRGPTYQFSHRIGEASRVKALPFDMTATLPTFIRHADYTGAESAAALA